MVVHCLRRGVSNKIEATKEKPHIFFCSCVNLPAFVFLCRVFLSSSIEHMRNTITSLPLFSFSVLSHPPIVQVVDLLVYIFCFVAFEGSAIW